MIHESTWKVFSLLPDFLTLNNKLITYVCSTDGGGAQERIQVLEGIPTLMENKSHKMYSQSCLPRSQSGAPKRNTTTPGATPILNTKKMQRGKYHTMLQPFKMRIKERKIVEEKTLQTETPFSIQNTRASPKEKKLIIDRKEVSSHTTQTTKDQQEHCNHEVAPGFCKTTPEPTCMTKAKSLPGRGAGSRCCTHPNLTPSTSVRAITATHHVSRAVNGACELPWIAHATINKVKQWIRGVFSLL